LSSVEKTAQGVELLYQSNADVVQELERLVEAEQGCCGAAGVEFELAQGKDGLRVGIQTVRDGLPAQTVVAAFAAMKVFNN